MLDLPNGEISLIELGQKKNDNDFMIWLDNNLVKSSNVWLNEHIVYKEGSVFKKPIRKN